MLYELKQEAMELKAYHLVLTDTSVAVEYVFSNQAQIWNIIYIGRLWIYSTLTLYGNYSIFQCQRNK